MSSSIAEDKSDAMERADRVIYFFALGVGHGLLRRAALSLGARHIFPALAAVLGTRENQGGLRLIEMSMTLDRDREKADVRELVAVRDSMTGTGYATTLVRQFVSDFLSTYRLTTSLRSRLITAFSLGGADRLLPQPGEMVIGERQAGVRRE